jgi:glycogen synthase
VKEIPIGFLFDAHKKKDDLADTVMQALSFIDKRPVEEKKVDKKQKPRKPTDNQKRTKYSKAKFSLVCQDECATRCSFQKGSCPVLFINR